MSNGFNVRILIEAIDKSTGPMRRIAAQIRGLSKTARQITSNLGGSFSEMHGAMGNMAAQAGSLATKLAAGAAVSGLAFKTMVFDQMVAWENLEVGLKGLLKSGTKAKQALSWISDFATRTPLEVQEVAQTFRLMTALGLKPMQGQMEAIVDATSALGGSQETMRRIALALGQAWVKQKLQGEEIMQLTEAGINVWDLLAKATGKNVKELQKLSSAGKLGRNEIQKLIETMGKEYKGQAQAMAGTTQGIISNLKDAWQRFNFILYQEGLLDFFKAELKGLLDQVNAFAQSGQLRQFAIEFKNHVIAVFTELKLVATQVWPVIQGLAQGFAAFARAVGGYGNVLKITIALLSVPFVASVIKAGIALFNFGKKIVELAKAGQWVQRGFVAIRAAMAVLSGPVGWVIAGITLLAGAAFLIIRNWTQVKAWFTNMWREWGGVIRLLVPPINAIVMLAGAVRNAWGPIKNFFQQLFSAIASAARQAANAFQPLISAAHQVKNAIVGAMAAARSNIGGAVERFKGFANRVTGHHPGRAHGGFVRAGTAYQVGEFGRELFVPGADGRILSNNTLRGLAGNGSVNGNISIHLKIDSEGRPRLMGVEQKGTNARLSLDMGLVNSYA